MERYPKSLRVGNKLKQIIMKTNVLFYAKTFLMALLFIGITSCEKDKDDEPATPQHKLSGAITNNSDHAVNNVSVGLYAPNSTTAAYTTKTNTDGKYELLAVNEGQYTVKAMGNGYNESTMDVNLTSNKTQDFIIAGNANVNGTIINSQTGSGLANATVSVMRASTSKELIVEFVVITDSYGNYELLGAAIGIFTITFEADGFFIRTIEGISFVDGDNTVEQQTIVEEPEEGTYRIVLSWGENPYDLDSHLTGPNGDARFHIFWANSSFDEGNINLDVDDIHSYGPETITIKDFTDGMYRYSIHNYSDQSTMGGAAIETSPTKVEIFNYDGLVSTFIAPAFTGEGNTWRVFEMTASGDNITIQPINTYLQASSDEDMEIFHNENGEKSTIPYLINEL